MSRMIAVGHVPPEALSQGSLNETPPAEQREVPAPKKLSDGPKVDAKTGNYQPASYKTKHGNVRQDR